MNVRIMVTSLRYNGFAWRMTARITFFVDGTASTAYNLDGDAKHLKAIAESFAVPVRVLIWEDCPMEFIPEGPNIQVYYREIKVTVPGPAFPFSR